MMRHQVDRNGSFPRFAEDNGRNQRRAFVYLHRQYGSLAEYRNFESLLRKKYESPLKKDKKKRKKLVNPLVKSCEKLLLTNFLTLISKLARELHWGGVRCL